MAQIKIEFDTNNPMDIRRIFFIMLDLYVRTNDKEVIIKPREKKEEPKQK